MHALNNAQLELLKLFSCDLSSDEIGEIKQILSEDLSKKLISEADIEAKERWYTPEIAASWKDEHFRTSYNK